MATEPITKQELIDAATDAQTFEDVVNSTDPSVTSRLGLEIKTLHQVIQDIGTFVYKGLWVTSTPYDVFDLVNEGGVVYVCLIAHSSGVFATDLADGKWGVYQDLVRNADIDANTTHRTSDGSDHSLVNNNIDQGVKTTDTPTFAGAAFSSFPTTPSSAPTTDYQVANKKFVDDSIPNIDVINTPITLYLSSTGDDTTGDGSVGNPWETIERAFEYLSTKLITASVTISIKNGTYAVSSRINLDHPNGEYITISGESEVGVIFNVVNGITCFLIPNGMSLQSLSNMTISYPGIQSGDTGVDVDFGKLMILNNVTINNADKCVASNRSIVHLLNCTFNQYNNGLVANVFSDVSASGCAFQGGVVGVPAGTAIFSDTETRVSCVANSYSYNTQSLVAENAGEITLDETFATFTGNTTNYTPTLSNGGSITYSSRFGRILSMS
jgi:hypothetical protein